MIYPKKNSIITYILHTYVRFVTRRYFNAINFNQIEIDQSRSILLIGNHFGWWDGFVLFWINGLSFKKQFHIMLLEETSQKTPILKYGGAFSINKKSKGIIHSLDFAALLLNDPNNLVLIFPQGKYYSSFITDVVFEKGIIKILKQAAGKFQLVFSATFIENFEHKKPTAYVYINNVATGFASVDELQAAYQQHYAGARQQQTQITKE